MNNKLFKGYLVWICICFIFFFSVFSSFLSFLFFNFSGVSVMGREVWNMYSFSLRFVDLSVFSSVCMIGFSIVFVFRDFANIFGIWDNKLLMIVFDLESFIKNSFSNGINILFKSEIINIWGWVRFFYNYKIKLW